MFRLILIVVVLLLTFVAAMAVALYQFFGWTGFIALPFILLAMAWLGKVVVVALFKKFALGLFSAKSSVLKGATMTLHSVVPTSKPVLIELNDVEPGDSDSDEADDNEDQDKVTESEEPQDYYAVDMTITPNGKCKGSVWEPGELILTQNRIKSLSDLQDDDTQLGSVEEVMIWNGSSFGSDDDGKYPGEQRTKIIFAVKPGTSRAWLHYYSEPIGELTLKQ